MYVYTHTHTPSVYVDAYLKIKMNLHENYSMITENKNSKDHFYSSEALVSSIFTYSQVVLVCSEPSVTTSTLRAVLQLLTFIVNCLPN